MEGLGQVELAALVHEGFGAQRLARGVADQALGEVHQRAVVRVRLVELHHGEFGVVARAEAFVAEVAVDLEHLLQAAHHQALEVELGRDAQEQLHVERVVVGGEGLGRGAARDGMHHRRLDLEEAVAGHVVADRLHQAAAGHEGVAGLLAHDEVHIALAVLGLGVGEAVELVGQRAQALGEEADLAALDRQLAGLGAEQGAHGADDVADVPALEVGVAFFAQRVAGDVELDAAGEVLDGDEAGLAHHALEHDAAGDLHVHRHRFELFGGFLAIDFVEFAGGVFPGEIVRIRLAGGAPFGELLAAFGDQVVFVLGGRVGLVGHFGLFNQRNRGAARPRQHRQNAAKP